ncbi:GNAT family N-acetyltransferase [Citricoccus sp. I39-566]|uniref:GNAT family N-acetyltransferase n=1 Tax=Citricoccus sp. I39-566 TaxID=3073268 RepID=UPI00286BBA03|nr:GNAT family N-acetyltransferase [Citricoccus sp. I39-566]WMY78006.1 GNAT family N-acetyltransferase [Citricoccus sp. I39-566]
MLLPPDPVLPASFTMRPMEWADLPTVHALEEHLFPVDAWPLSFFEEELAQAVPEHDGGTRAYRVITGPVPGPVPPPAFSGQESPVIPALKVQGSGAPAEGEAGAGEGAGVVLGYCGLMCVPPLADVQTIAVVPEAEGRGLGTAMLQWMVAESGRRRARDLLLEVRQDNPRAQALYARHGFEHIHTRAGYYPGDPAVPGPGGGSGRVDALIMRRRLVG